MCFAKLTEYNKKCSGNRGWKVDENKTERIVFGRRQLLKTQN
jgi:hypothetical protein